MFTAALFICTAGASAPGTALAAAQFTASPLLLNLPADKRAAALTLGNQGGQPVTVQAELLSWNQDSGDDAYAPTRDLLVSPPIFSIPGAGSQVVRVGRLKAGVAPEREIAYRLKLAEVPTAAAKGGGIATVMQLSFPLFVPPADRKAAPRLEGVVETQAKRGLLVTLTNSGLVHGKVTALRIVQNGATLSERPMNFYVLAGAKRPLPWPGALKGAKAGAAEVQVQLEGKNKVIALPVTVSP